jgi:hypothetical protein
VTPSLVDSLSHKGQPEKVGGQRDAGQQGNQRVGVHHWRTAVAVKGRPEESRKIQFFKAVLKRTRFFSRFFFVTAVKGIASPDWKGLPMVSLASFKV